MRERVRDDAPLLICRLCGCVTLCVILKWSEKSHFLIAKNKNALFQVIEKFVTIKCDILSMLGEKLCQLQTHCNA